MIRTFTTPTVRLEIKAGTVVKITLAVMATKFAARVASDVAAPYAEKLTAVMKRRIDKLVEEDNKDDGGMTVSSNQ